MRHTATILISLLLLVTACSRVPAAVLPTFSPTTDRMPTAIAVSSTTVNASAASTTTATSTPKAATATASPRPTQTSASTPKPLPKTTPFIFDRTPLPQPAGAINQGNAEHVVQIARWGMGKPINIGYSADGAYFFVITSLGMWLYDAKTGEPINHIETGGTVSAGDISPDGNQVALFSDDEDTQVKLYNRKDGSLIKTIPAPHPIAWDLKYAPDGQQIAFMWDYKMGPYGSVIDPSQSQPDEEDKWIMAVSPDGRYGVLRDIVPMKIYDLLEAKYTIAQVEAPPLPAEQMGEWDRDGQYMQVALAPDGKRMAYTSIDTITFFELGSQQPSFIYKPIETYHKCYTYDVCKQSELICKNPVPFTATTTDLLFSSNSQWVAIGLQDGRLQIRRFTDGYLIYEFSGFEVTSESRYIGKPVAFSPDSRQFAYLNSGMVYFVRTSDWSIERKLPLTYYDVNALSFSPTEPYLAASGSKTWLWQIPNSQPLAEHEVKGNALAFSYEGKELVIGTDQGQMGWVWMDAPERIRLEPYTSTPILSLTFLANNRYLVTANNQCTINLWDAQTGKFFSQLKQFDWDPVESIIASPDGRFFIVFNDNIDEEIPVYDLVNGSLADWTPYSQRLPENVKKIIFSPDHNYSALFIEQWGMSQVIELENNQEKNWPNGPRHRIFVGVEAVAAFSADSNLLAVGKYGQISLYSVPDGKILTTFAAHMGEITGLSFSADGHWLASSSKDGTIRLWGIRNSNP